MIRALLVCLTVIALPAQAATVCRAGPPVTPDNSNLLGMNLGTVNDYAEDRMYADAVKSARIFKVPGSGSPGTEVATDADGWPTVTAFEFYPFAGIPDMHGTYALSFTGRASSVTGSGWASIGALDYNAGTNTTTATLTITATGAQNVTLSLAGAYRDAGTSSPGVVAMKLMRPTSPGSATPYASDVLFTDHLKAVIAKVSVVRYKDFVGTDENKQEDWSDRLKPTRASLNRTPAGYGWEGVGAPWEHVILLSNETDTDPWIALPHLLSDDYLTKVAQVFKCGSDGSDPWVEVDGTTCKANPTYPALESGRKLYIEYSNELWNTGAGYSQTQDNHALAQTEAAAENIIDFDGITNAWHLAWRRAAKRGAEQSVIFRTVFGDAAMMTRVRPVLATQIGVGQDMLGHAIDLLYGYYANFSGANPGTPHPPSYYFWGCGGSGYYMLDNASDTLTVDNIWTSYQMDLATWRTPMAKDTHHCMAMGLTHVAYEGGPHWHLTGHSDAVKEQAWSDPRMMTAVVEHHDEWTAQGGGLLMYYQAFGSFEFAFATSAFDLDTPKYDALDYLKTVPRAALTIGTAAPGSVAGNAFDVSSLRWEASGTGAKSYAAGTWRSYTFREPTGAARDVVVNLSSAGAGDEIAVYVDGVQLGSTVSAVNGDNTFAAGSLSKGLHGVIVRAVSGSFTVNTVAVE